MKKALILGTNAGQADIIEYLKEEGWEVHSCGYRKEGPGVDLAHQFHLANTVDVDSVKKVAIKIAADIIYSVSSDINIRTATKVSEDLGLPVILSSDVIDLFHYKERLRDFLNRNNISPVGFIKVTTLDEISDWSYFPCVVKPNDSQGQRGVQLINKKEELKEAVALALEQSKSATVIIEEYLTGVEVSTNIAVQNGKIIINEFTERLVFGTEYFGLPKGHSIPVREITKEQLDEAVVMSEKLVKALSLKNAILYIQMKITNNGAKVIEIAPRLDGCHIWRLLREAKGYDFRGFAIKCLTKEPIKYKVKDREVSRMTLQFHHLKTGEEFQVSNLNLSKKILYNEYRYKDGEKVNPINGNLEVVGYYIFKD